MPCVSSNVFSIRIPGLKHTHIDKWYVLMLESWQYHSHDDEAVENSTLILIPLLLIAAHHIRLALASEAWRHLGGQDSMRASLLACQASIGDLGAWGGWLCYHRFVACWETLNLTNKWSARANTNKELDGSGVLLFKTRYLLCSWHLSLSRLEMFLSK